MASKVLLFKLMLCKIICSPANQIFLRRSHIFCIDLQLREVLWLYRFMYIHVYASCIYSLSFITKILQVNFLTLSYLSTQLQCLQIHFILSTNITGDVGFIETEKYLPLFLLTSNIRLATSVFLMCISDIYCAQMMVLLGYGRISVLRLQN